MSIDITDKPKDKPEETQEELKSSASDSDDSQEEYQWDSDELSGEPHEYLVYSSEEESEYSSGQDDCYNCEWGDPYYGTCPRCERYS